MTNHLTPILFFSVVVSFLTACDSGNHKTDSMIYRESVTREARPLIDKARGLITEDALNSPEQHLDHLIIARNALLEADKVYQQRGITNPQSGELAEMKSAIHRLLPALSQRALVLAEESIDVALQTRSKVEKIKSRPKALQSSDISDELGSLTKEFNRELDECCLQTLGKINDLLAGDLTRYEDLLRVTMQMNYHLDRLMREKGYATTLREKLSQLRRQPA